MTHLPVCRACGSQETRLRYQVQGYDIFACARCGSSTTAASMGAEEARKFYGYDYFHGGDYHNYPDSELTLKRNFETLTRRLRRLQPAGSLLEIGCAYGYFLDVAQAHWQVTGVDISQDAIENSALRFPNRVFAGDLSTLSFQEGQFDWVVAWDVIEHLDTPREMLARSYALLRPGGRLAITTGDISSRAARALGSRWRLLTPPSHLTFFSRKGMRQSLEEAGFGEIKFRTMGYHRNLDFAFFRLLGEKRYHRLSNRLPGLSKRFKNLSFYIDLGDIMFVTAHKPVVRPATTV